MVKRVVITNYRGESVEYKIEGVDVYKNNGLLITEIEGLGPAGADVIFTKLVSTDGSLFNTSRLTERNIVIHANFTWVNTTEEARLSSYKFFPLGKKVSIYVETDNRKAVTSGYVEKNEPNIFKSETDVMISILCESPYFTDSAGEITSDWFSNIVPCFEFEYENVGTGLNTIFSEYIDKNESVWNYNGESEIGFVLVVHALDKVINPTLYFITHGTKLLLPTASIVSKVSGVTYFGDGDDIIITSMPTKKKIQYMHNGVLTDVMSVLPKDIDWPVLYPGENKFAYSAESGGEFIRLYLQYTGRYEGV